MLERQLNPAAVSPPRPRLISFQSVLGAMISKALLGLIWLYRLILSPLLSGSCRFEPSCSNYAEEVIKKHGPARGAALAVKRFLRCNPWGPFGSDPAP